MEISSSMKIAASLDGVRKTNNNNINVKKSPKERDTLFLSAKRINALIRK